MGFAGDEDALCSTSECISETREREMASNIQWEKENYGAKNGCQSINVEIPFTL
jgi:hypothetical protein